MMFRAVVILIFIVEISALDNYKCPNTNSSSTEQLLQELCHVDNFSDVLYHAPSNTAYYFWKNRVAAQNTATLKVVDGYPKFANDVWPGVPENFDAAFSLTTTNRTYFLKGSQYWSFLNNTLEPGYPKPISEGFHGVPDNIDAATEWDHYVYFFKGNMYYRYSPCQNSTFSAPITDFAKVWNSGIQGVYRHTNNYAYFLKGGVYIGYYIPNSGTSYLAPAAIGYNLFSCRYNP